MLNHITIMGRLTKDPELRYTQNQTPVASFTLACDRSTKKDAEKQTDFIECVAWQGTAEMVSKYFTKGRMAAVEGRLQIRPWKDKEGNNRKTAEVVVSSIYFADSNKQNSEQRSEQSYAPARDDGYAELEDDGELPF